MKILKKIKKFDFKNYIFLLFLTNITSIIFLNDTSTYNTGLISLQSIFYCLNRWVFIALVLTETISSFLDAYGLNINFLKVTLVNPNQLDIEFIFNIFFENIKYIFFLFLNIFFLYYLNFFKNIFDQKKIYIKIFFLIFLFVIALIYFLNSKNELVYIYKKRLISKMEFYTEGNIFRNDNWYLVLKYSLKYKEEKIKKISFNFKNAIDYSKFNNIYIIINESYPNFKDKNLKNILLNHLVQDLKNTKIEKYKMNWSKNYSTQGAELKLLCANENLFKDFKELDLLKFVNKHNCWIKKFENKKKIFIHSYEEKMFNRERYKSFFDETYFLNSLKAYKLKTCKGVMEGICDQEIVDKIFPKIKKYKESKLTIFLTLNNHVPLIVLKDRSKCSQYPLNQHDQFCSLYNNQTILNKSINNFLKTLDKNDILIFFSDTPPMFSLRDRKHFEDYVEVFFFTKIN